MAGVDMWNQRYAADGYLFGVAPNAFLKSQAPRLQPGWRALAVADGEGRNGVWLAEQGLTVTSVDASPVALAKARRLAASRNVDVTFIEADLSSWNWPVDAFDCVAAIFIQFAGPDLRARLFANMANALAPGGLLFLQGYRLDQIGYGTGGPRLVENLYTEELLRSAFTDLELLSLSAHDSVIHEGTGHAGLSALVDLVARKPR